MNNLSSKNYCSIKQNRYKKKIEKQKRIRKKEMERKNIGRESEKGGKIQIVEEILN